MLEHKTVNISHYVGLIILLVAVGLVYLFGQDTAGVIIGLPGVLLALHILNIKVHLTREV